MLVASFFISISAHADEIQFSEEELPKEAVMPRLDTPKAVLNRKLSYEKKFTADLAYGWLLDEPFYNNQYIAALASYSTDESNGFGVKYLSFGSGVSDYSKQFQASATPGPDFSQAPGPKNGYMLFYERRMMYGKLSIAKKHVMPSFLIWDAEAGMMTYGSRQLPLAGGAIANRFFLKPQLGVSLTLHAYFRQLVDPLSQNLKTAHSEGDFSTKTKLSTALDVSLSYLF